MPLALCGLKTGILKPNLITKVIVLGDRVCKEVIVSRGERLVMEIFPAGVWVFSVPQRLMGYAKGSVPRVALFAGSSILGGGPSRKVLRSWERSLGGNSSERLL